LTIPIGANEPHTTPKPSNAAASSGLAARRFQSSIGVALHSLQFIGPSGTKRFLKGGCVAGLCFPIGGAGKVVCIAEGYATDASIDAATEYAVAVAFNASNLGRGRRSN